MAYPKECPACRVQYRGFGEQGTAQHVTVAAVDGGTPSPWLPDRPGRLLELACRECSALFEWDYFGLPLSGDRLGRLEQLLRAATESEPTAPISRFELTTGSR